MLPRQLGNVDEAVHAAEVDERTEVDDARHDTLADLARLEVGEEILALFLLRLFEPCTTAEDHVVAVLVELDDLGLHGLADVGLQVAYTAKLDERSREESTEADVDDEAALDDFDDRTLDDAVVLFDLLDRAPGPLVLGTLLGENEATLFVFLGENECFDLFAQGNDLGRINVVADAGSHPPAATRARRARCAAAPIQAAAPSRARWGSAPAAGPAR